MSSLNRLFLTSYSLSILIRAEQMSFLCGRFFRCAYWMAIRTAQGAAVTKRVRSLPLFSSARPPPLPAPRSRLSRQEESLFFPRRQRLRRYADADANVGVGEA